LVQCAFHITIDLKVVQSKFPLMQSCEIFHIPSKIFLFVGQRGQSMEIFNKFTPGFDKVSRGWTRLSFIHWYGK